MAQSGPKTDSGLQCGHCGVQLSSGDFLCPSCGSRLMTMLCARCGHRGPREEFYFNRCPTCGHRPDLGSAFMGPVLIFAVIILVLILSFFLAR